MKNIFILWLVLGCKSLFSQAPAPFLPEIFKQFPNVRDFAMTANGSEIYFTVESFKKDFSAILFIKKINGKWTAPETAIFSGQYRDLEPFFSMDGLTLYFVSKRPLNDTAVRNDFDIWFVKRATLTGPWSAAVNLGAPVNTAKDEFYPSLSSSGNIYFTRESDDENRKEDIFRSVFSNGKYETAVALSDSVNSPTFEFNAYVSPDEQFLLFSSFGRPDDMGGSDLYISSKNSQGEWTAARNLGTSINSKRIDYCPFWDAKNKVLYFTSERNSVKTQYNSRQGWSQLKKELYQYSNGMSRIYFRPFDPAKN